MKDLKSLTLTQSSCKIETSLVSNDLNSTTEGWQGHSIDEILDSLERSIKNEYDKENIAHIFSILKEKLKEKGICG